MGNPFQVDTICWLIGGFLTLYYSDIVNVLKIDPRIEANYFYASVTTSLIPFGICLYLIIWLSGIKNVSSDDWDIQAPYAIPIATLFAVVSGLLWNITLWGVYRFMTPIILFLLMMGFVMTISILPPWTREKKVKVKNSE